MAVIHSTALLAQMALLSTSGQIRIPVAHRDLSEWILATTVTDDRPRDHVITNRP